MNPIAIDCAAALGLLLFGLGPVISGLRGRTDTFIGAHADPADTLHKFVRAHGNTAEYAPFLALMILYLGARHPAAWVVWAMIAATVCRYLFVAGMIFPATMAKPNILRFVGAAGTYVAGVALCAALLVS